MLNRNIFYSQAIDFLNQLYIDLKSLSATFPKHWHIDHICYRTSTNAQYVSLKKAFLDFSDLMIESPINGRNISTFALREPLIFNEHHIYNVELPEPKPGSQYQDGFEHIEMVCDKPLNSLPTLYPQLHWKPQSGNKAYNTELRCDFKSGSIKFHNQALSSVIHLKKKPKIFQRKFLSFHDSRYRPMLSL
jgi:hypothetical protein